MSSQLIFEAIGTHWVIDLYGEYTAEQVDLVYHKILERIAIFDKTYSRFRDDSVVSEMARTAGDYVLPDDAKELFAVYKKMYDVTHGLVTPLIGQVLVDAGYDAKYSLIQKKPLTKPLGWDEVFSYTAPQIHMRVPALLDFGAAGKGYCVDVVSQVIEGYGIHAYCVDAGGDMRHRHVAGPALTVGLEHPEDTTQVIGTVTLSNASLCGSAGNRRVWQNFHHVISPETLTSPQDILAVWVVADSTIVADALTTGLFFVSPDILRHHFTFEYVIIKSDYSCEKSDGFPGELFLEKR